MKDIALSDKDVTVLDIVTALDITHEDLYNHVDGSTLMSKQDCIQADKDNKRFPASINRVDNPFLEVHTTTHRLFKTLMDAISYGDDWTLDMTKLWATGFPLVDMLLSLEQMGVANGLTADEDWFGVIDGMGVCVTVGHTDNIWALLKALYM